MPVRALIALTLIATAVAIAMLGVAQAEAVPAFARQYDVQCSACHTRPPRLNRFGEMFHMMGFQMPGAARSQGIVGSLKEDGPLKTAIDSLALRIVGNMFEVSSSPDETEVALEPPHEFELFVARPLLPDLSIFAEIEYEPNALKFERGRGFFIDDELKLGNEAFFMANLGRLVAALGAPSMEMGNQVMIGEHGGFNIHGPMLMAGKIDPNTNFSYPTNRQLLEPTETEVEEEDGTVHRLPVVPYALTSKFFGLFKDQDEGEPLLPTDLVLYNTRGAPGADFHAMVGRTFRDWFVLGQMGFMRENEGFNMYAMTRLDLGEWRGMTFNASLLLNGGLGVARAPDPDDHEQPGSRRLDRLRYGIAANARWKQLDVYGALIFDRVFGLPRALDREFDRDAAGLTLEVDYLLLEQVLLSTRFDQLWAGGLRDDKRDGTVLSVQVKYYPWPNIAFFVRNSVNLRSSVDDNALRSWRNQFFAGIDWDF